jgi:hypothetical protein
MVLHQIVLIIKYSNKIKVGLIDREDLEPVFEDVVWVDEIKNTIEGFFEKVVKITD